MKKSVFLKPNVVLEPLVGSWYAWSHLIFPPTAARNVVKRHIPIMNSFVQSPSFHVQAVLNPKMRGGPFIDYDLDRVEEIRSLRDFTYINQNKLIELSQAIETLDRLLSNDAIGYSMEEIYKKVPDLLKGYVELFYNRHNKPDFRFFEHLIYKSDFYQKKYQSIALWITNNDHRPFCLSTPRLKDSNILHLPISFDDVRIDELAKMKRIPQSFEYIADLFNTPQSDHKLFSTFFTEIPPNIYKKYDGDCMRMRYFGHACILIETKNISILVDPLISYYGYATDTTHFSDADLPDMIDYVLITHNHQDHILFETLLPLRHKIRNIIVPRTCGGKLEDPNVQLMFNNIGFNNVISLEEMQTVASRQIDITSLPFTGEHSDLNIIAKACYLVKIGTFKLLFMADSRVIQPELYRNVHEEIGDIDVLFLGMECDGAPLSWLYGPLLTHPLPKDQDGSRRLSGSDCDKGMFLVDIFNPKEVYVYAMGQEPWVEFISSIKYTDQSNPIVESSKLIDICHSRGIVAERLYGEKEILYPYEA